MFLPLFFKMQHLLCQRVVSSRNLAAGIMFKDALALGTDLCRAHGTGNFRVKYLDLRPIGAAQERRNLFAVVRSAVHHREQYAVDFQLVIDIALDLDS